MTFCNQLKKHKKRQTQQKNSIVRKIWYMYKMKSMMQYMFMITLKYVEQNNKTLKSKAKLIWVVKTLIYSKIAQVYTTDRKN